jgi:copper oxidase (laccase) domain-containing protein
MKQKFDSSPEKLICVIGPAISKEHYQVGLELVEKAQRMFDANDLVTYKDADKYFMDLPLANKILLNKCGVKVVDSLGICTCGNKEDWYSHRGDNGKTGRFAAVIAL